MLGGKMNPIVWQTDKISTIVDSRRAGKKEVVWQTDKISTIVDFYGIVQKNKSDRQIKFLLL